MKRGGSGVDRRRVESLAGRYELPAGAAGALARLLSALAAEADPPTTIRDPREAIDRHLADSLSALALASVRDASSLVDVGSGAGFPGLPLAVALPDATVDLVESGRRKTEVVARLAGAAGAVNVRVVSERAETWAAAEGREAYDVVTVRAVAALATLAEYAAPLLRLGGSLVAWKGARDREEERSGARAAARLGLEPGEVVRVEPFAGARDRHLHVLVKRSPTPLGVPRRPGLAAKRPLT